MSKHTRYKSPISRLKPLFVIAVIALGVTILYGGFTLGKGYNSNSQESVLSNSSVSTASLNLTIKVINPSSTYNIVVGQATQIDSNGQPVYSTLKVCKTYSAIQSRNAITCSVSPRYSTITMGIFVIRASNGSIISTHTRKIYVTTKGSDSPSITLPTSTGPTSASKPNSVTTPTASPTPATVTSGYGILSSGLRDKYKWPFASSSIWNTPIGSGAVYQNAGILRNYTDNYYTRFTVDQDVIIMQASEPLASVKYSSAGWGGNRCSITSDTFPSGASGIKIPLSANYILSSSGENNAAAALLSDGSTVGQFVAFTRCAMGQNATAFRNFSDVSLYSEGISGSHGGSGLSALGGTIRVGEFTKGIIRHALKVNLYSRDYYYSGCVPKWPATVVDNYCSGTYKGSLSVRTPGALLALKPDFNVSSLRTTPGKIIAQALIDYGGYIVDDTKWNAWAIAMEQGPDGRVVDEFKNLYGFSPIVDSDSLLNSSYGLDIKDIFQSFYVITNNSASSIGGGGTPRKSIAPAIGN